MVFCLVAGFHFAATVAYDAGDVSDGDGGVDFNARSRSLRGMSLPRRPPLLLIIRREFIKGTHE